MYKNCMCTTQRVHHRSKWNVNINTSCLSFINIYT